MISMPLVNSSLVLLFVTGLVGAYVSNVLAGIVSRTGLFGASCFPNSPLLSLMMDGMEVLEFWSDF